MLRKIGWLAAAALAAMTALWGGLAAAQDKVSVAALRFVSSAPIFIAQEKGYFKEQGLDVELKFFDAAQPIAVAVAAGDAEFGITGLTGGFFNLAGKGAIKIIASQSREEPGYDFVAYVVSARAWEAGFRDVRQFPGKVVGITQIGSTFHYMLGRLAEKRGFRLDEVQLKALQSIPNVIAAIKGQQVDAVLLPANFALGLEKEGAARVVGWVQQETPWQLGALFAGSKVIAERRPLVERFVRAYQKATADYADAFQQRDAGGARVFGEKADALIPVIQKYVQPQPSAEQVKASVSFIDPQGRLLVGDIYQQVAWYKRMGMISGDVAAARILDLSFVDGHLDVPGR